MSCKALRMLLHGLATVPVHHLSNSMVLARQRIQSQRSRLIHSWMVHALPQSADWFHPWLNLDLSRNAATESIGSHGHHGTISA